MALRADGVDALLGPLAMREIIEALDDALFLEIDRDGAGGFRHFQPVGQAIDAHPLPSRRAGWHCEWPSVRLDRNPTQPPCLSSQCRIEPPPANLSVRCRLGTALARPKGSAAP